MLYLKKLRRFIDEHYPGRILLCEANQWPEDVRPYFGDGDEFQMGFHFPVMPRIFMAIRQGRGGRAGGYPQPHPAIPDSCQWAVFLRNHDELTLEMVTEEERHWMWQEYAPEERMRLNLGIRRRLAPLLDNDIQKIALANSMLFSLPGSPILYYGDEIGMGDNIWLPDRNGVRTPMQWTAEADAGFSTAGREQLYAPVISEPPYEPARVSVAVEDLDPDSLLNTVRQMIKIRRNIPSFGEGTFEWALPGENPSVLAYWRRLPGEAVLVVQNLSPLFQQVTIADSAGADFTDLWTNEPFSIPAGGVLPLEGHAFRWLRLEE